MRRSPALAFKGGHDRLVADGPACRVGFNALLDFEDPSNRRLSGLPQRLQLPGWLGSAAAGPIPGGNGLARFPTTIAASKTPATAMPTDLGSGVATASVPIIPRASV
jgi:hypothetical protein